MICLDEIVGYMTENSIWHLMDFLLRARFDKTPAHLNPYMIGVDHDEFCFLEKNVEKSNVEESEYVWQIGHLAFYALMGMPAFGADDDRTQIFYYSHFLPFFFANNFGSLIFTVVSLLII